jgi:hypothetical protein
MRACLSAACSDGPLINDNFLYAQEVIRIDMFAFAECVALFCFVLCSRSPQVSRRNKEAFTYILFCNSMCCCSVMWVPCGELVPT